MTVITSHYHALQCNARVDNIVQPICGATSPGAWHDAEEMERVAIERGWSKAGKGHHCPSCTAAASPAGAEAETPKAPRRTKAKVAAVPEPEWAEQEAVNQ